MKPTMMSYIAASVFPVKVLKQAKDFYRGGKLYPLHPQISLTNKCNLACDFCSCVGVNRAEELDYIKAEQIMQGLYSFGAKALTITGGGEPTLYSRFDDFVKLIKDDLEMEIGMVTNGTTLAQMKNETIRRWTWCRISLSDDRDMDSLLRQVREAVRRVPEVDWAFSYVVTPKFNLNKMAEAIREANDLDFTHVRLVSDLTDLNHVPDLGKIMLDLQEMGVDDSKVIYQGRKGSQRGAARCLISLIKPFVGTDGKVYPCCGIQYAINDLTLDFDERMCMGGDIWNIYNKQQNFDGTICDVCYYGHYNDVLGKLTSPVNHEVFI